MWHISLTRWLPVLPLLLAPRIAFATCTWNASAGLPQAYPIESHGLAPFWSAVPTGGGCTGFTLDHYRAVLKEGGYPASPSDGVLFVNTSSTTVQALPNRAQRTYYARIYACDDAACTDKFGDAAGEVITGDTGTNSTAQEVWLIKGVQHNTGGITAGVDVSTNDVSVFIYPSTFSNSGHLAIYGRREDSTHHNISYARTTSSGWLNYNTTSYTAIQEVAGSHTSDADYDGTSHPYTFPVFDGSNYVVKLLAQNQGASTDQGVWTDSTDDVGDDFGLYCASCCKGSADTECDWPAAETGGTAGVAVCADGTSTCSYFSTALHGRWMWPYLAYPAPDLSADEPSILFTGQPDGTTCPDADTPLPDIYRADWDSSSQTWVPYDSADAGACPDAIIEDAHDPAVTPLGGGQYKVYVIDDAHQVTAHYFNGSSWEAGTSTPQIVFDDLSPTVVTHDCIANPDSFVAAGPHEGMFMYIAHSLTYFQSGTCTQGDDYSGGGHSKIFFAELKN